jgi:hypothetical protein
LVRHNKKRIRFGSEDKKKIPDFIDPNKDPSSYLRRYITEQTYKDWFDRNYPDYTIYEAVGLEESDFQEMKKRFSPEQEETSVKEQTEPEPESDDRVTGKWTSDPNKPQDAPATESQKSSDEQIINAEQENLTKKRANKLFWLRVVFAVIGGIAATFLFDGIEDSEEHRWTSIIFMISLFLVTCFMAKVMKINFPKSDRKKIVTTGIGSFIFMYLFAWIMSFTLLNLPQDNMSIPFT